MTGVEFIAKIQAYYGPYPPGQLPTVSAYLQGKPGLFLEQLYKVCLLKFSAKWKTPPDIAIFEELREEAKQAYKQLSPLPSAQLIEKDEPVATTEEALSWITKIKDMLAKKKTHPRFQRNVHSTHLNREYF